MYYITLHRSVELSMADETRQKSCSYVRSLTDKVSTPKEGGRSSEGETHHPSNMARKTTHAGLRGLPARPTP